MEAEYLFTPSGLMDLLSQIDELSEAELSFTEDASGLSISINSNVYRIKESSATEIQASPDVVEQISEVNQEGYDSLDASSRICSQDVVEGAFLKELAKDVFVGGFIKLTELLTGKAQRKRRREKWES